MLHKNETSAQRDSWLAWLHELSISKCCQFSEMASRWSNPFKKFPCQDKMQCNIAAPSWRTDHAPTALLTLGKAAWAHIFLDRCFHAAIHTYPRTLGICSKRFTRSMGAGLRSGGHQQQRLVTVQGSSSSQPFSLPLYICPTFIFSLPLFPCQQFASLTWVNLKPPTSRKE